MPAADRSGARASERPNQTRHDRRCSNIVSGSCITRYASWDDGRRGLWGYVSGAGGCSGFTVRTFAVLKEMLQGYTVFGNDSLPTRNLSTCFCLFYSFQQSFS